ncbi:CHAT domain-containing protein [Nostoc spongiaeforme FACHB-130]|uniref:CHAT domain-containing protein n=1 Tax=Nostoc spongiaeforme FACHB-130 TaxID=1357510 RepID=A0ABR8FZJ1_9NOSO|nr:CHAT domain-containing protein [Nostoc spongiaeforme]MBD2596486.1 CHAT domain-containing protein [Nostoc spongiaeforme FACHB-130]
MKSLIIFINLLLVSELLGVFPLIALAQSSSQPSPSTQPQPPTEAETQVLVSEVVVEGAPEKLEDLVYKTIQIKPGKKTTRSQLQEDINAIFATGWFSNVRAEPADTPLGVRVTFIVKTNPVLKKVEVTAVSKASTILSPQVVNSIFSKDYGSTLNLNKLQNNIAQLNKWYQDKGYILSSIVGPPQVDDNGVVKLEVAEGVIEDIQVKFVTDDDKEIDEDGKPIEGKIPAKLIIEEFNIKPGQIFLKSVTQQQIKHLFDFGLFKNVEVAFDTGKDKNKVIAIIKVKENELAEKLGEKFFVNQQALNKAQANKDELGIANATNNIANIYADLKEKDDQKKAIPKYQEALKVFQKKQDLIGQAKVFNNLGNTYNKIQEYKQAIENYNQSLILFQKLQMPFWEALTLNNLALNYRELDEKEMALEIYTKALKMWQKFSKNPSLAKLGVNKPDEDSKSIKTSSVYFAIATSNTKGTSGSSGVQIGNSETLQYLPLPDVRLWEAETLFNISGIYQALADYQQAMYIFSDAEKIWQSIDFNKLGSTPSPSLSLIKLFPKVAKAKLYVDVQQFGQAVNQINSIIIEASSLASKIKFKSDEQALIKQLAPFAIALINDFVNDNEIGDNNNFLEKQWPIYKPLFQVILKQIDQTYYQYINNLLSAADSYFSQDNQLKLEAINILETEYQSLEKAYPQFTQFSGFVISYLGKEKGKILTDLGRNSEAVAAYQKALSAQPFLGVILKNDRPEILYLIGKSYLNNRQYQKAEESFNKSLTESQTNKQIIQEADAYLGLAMLERQRGNFQKAQAQIEKAIATIESEGAQIENAEREEKDKYVLRLTPYRSYTSLAKYLESKQNYYAFYVDFLMQLHQKNPKAGYDTQGLQASERSHARSLLAIINRTNQSSRLGKQNQKQSDARAVELAKPVEIQQIQKEILDDNTLLLEYLLGEENSYLWLVSKTGVSSYQLPKLSEIEPLARKFYTAVSSPNPSLRDRQSSQQLSQILLGQVASQLGQKRLLIVADGILQYIPFNALPHPNSPADKPEPLLVKHEIVGLPSVSTLAVIRNKQNSRKPSKNLAIFADPIFSRSDERLKSRLTKSNDEELYERLPGTRQEANKILSLFPNSQKLVKFDFAANRQAAINPEISQYRFVHFASHGILDSQRPERSGMVMSVVNEVGDVQRSLLSIPDTFNLKLSADLVVLSGCRTGLGKTVKGEGLVGLTGGLMYAGGKSVVSSLWDVADDSTALLMSKFYSAILQKGLKPSSALRQAQLEMWRDSQWNAPYYWSAFVFQGEWN